MPWVALPTLRQSFSGLPDDHEALVHRLLKEAVRELAKSLDLENYQNWTHLMHSFCQPL